MHIIRSEDRGIGDTETQLLIAEWGMRRICQVKGCTKEANTIIHDGPRGYTLCEEHFQMGNKPGGCTLTVEGVGG